MDPTRSVDPLGYPIFAVLLAVGGVAVAGQDAALAAICLACAGAAPSAVDVIEPATAARAVQASVYHPS
jgi:hypothetical protein